jgi:glucose-6-phosphate 1-dehydrogenase
MNALQNLSPLPPAGGAGGGVLIVLFGATGDLAKRKIFPALFSMSEAGQLPKKTVILGAGLSKDTSEEKFRELSAHALHDFLEDHSDRAVPWCNECLFFQNLTDDTNYAKLKERIESLEKEHNFEGNRILYLAIPPVAFGPTIESLGNANLQKSNGWTRLVIEKPFGHDLASAKELNDLVHKYFDEQQVYRIDHYLGKETVQNLLAFRFGNALFESVWNREKIAKVEITVAEELGIESRANYYERAGALRDMVQNHITQLLCLTAMETPSAFHAADVRYEKIKVLKSIAPIKIDDVVFGQYAEGEIDGQGVRAYRAEDGVKPDSNTETFVAIKLQIEDWRWSGVPFYLRSGKRLKKRISEIVVTFRRPPVSIFKDMKVRELQPNQLVIVIQPNEGFRMSFQVKKPGNNVQLQTEWMHFSYSEAFGELPEAYHTLLLDVIEGDQTLFVSAEETEASWALYTPLLEAPHDLKLYPSGSWGPPNAR